MFRDAGEAAKRCLLSRTEVNPDSTPHVKIWREGWRRGRALHQSASAVTEIKVKINIRSFEVRRWRNSAFYFVDVVSKRAETRWLAWRFWFHDVVSNIIFGKAKMATWEFEGASPSSHGMFPTWKRSVFRASVKAAGGSLPWLRFSPASTR